MKEILFVPKPYPPEFRRNALELLESGRSVRDVAAALGIAESCLHRWRRQVLVERGLKPFGPAEAESAALAQARARIAELENEVKILRKAAAAVELAGEGVPVKQACLALGVSRSGFYDARTRPLSARAIRQAWLTDQINALHQASRQTYGSPRVRAEFVQGQGVVVSRKTVAVLMQRAGLAGLTLRRRAKRGPRRGNGHRPGETRLPPRWTQPAVGHRHHRAPHPRGQALLLPGPGCLLRRVVGWVIDSWQRANLATSALGLAIGSRVTAGQIPDTIIRADHGTQLTSRTFTERARRAGLLPSLGTVADPYDNAVAGSFWARMQTELLEAWLSRLTNRCKDKGVDVAVIWVRCDVDSMREYIEFRDAPRDAWKLAKWDEHASGINTESSPPGVHLTVDNRLGSAITVADQTRDALRKVLG
ncbi:IS3 family transposase [Actinomadura coerulea]|uniref:IS3 family transposase n=1 Tax=Actinomadura coerulea TaxID=46159 RepID=UPI003433D915